MEKQSSSERSNKLEQSQRSRKRQDQRLILRKSLIWCFILISAFLIFNDSSQTTKQAEISQSVVQVATNDETVGSETVEKEEVVVDSVNEKVQELSQESQQTEEKAATEQLSETDIQSPIQPQASKIVTEPVQSVRNVPSQASTQESQSIPTEQQPIKQFSQTPIQSIESSTIESSDKQKIQPQAQAQMQNFQVKQAVKLQ